MRFALVEGQRQEAQPNLSGNCPLCGSPLVAKCGDIRMRHWAHLGRRACDHWWETETEWHRGWKAHFPFDWQEFIQRADNGEKHIADVKTDRGWVLEFQHSHLDPDERRARDAFYPRLVWVVDGLRRKRDKSQFFKALEDWPRVCEKPIVRSAFPDESVLLRDWSGSHAPVCLDFGESEKPEDAALWCILPGSTDGRAFVLAFPRAEFIDLHRAAKAQAAPDFAEYLKKFAELVSTYISLLRVQSSNQLARQPGNHWLRRRRRF